jgi:hypothetical protein
MSEAEPPRLAAPTYVYRCIAATVLLLIATTVSVMLMFADGGVRYAQVAAVAFSVLATVVAGVAIVCVRQDRLMAEVRREETLTRKFIGTGLEALVEHAETIGHRVEESAAYHMAIEGQKAKVHAEYLFDLAMKEIENSNLSTIQLDGLRDEMSTLAAQQETLAEMVAGCATVTIDVANGDVYELGKRVGRDEVLRERGDQTP